MTNLQILLNSLNLSEEENQKAILDNFDDQDKTTFVINNRTYKFFKEREIEDLLFDQYEDDILDFEDHCESYTGFNYSRFINVTELIQKRVDLLEVDDLNNFTYITEEGGYYILEEY